MCLCNLFIASICSQGYAVIALAYFSIAAILLKAGKTAFLQCSILLNLKTSLQVLMINYCLLQQ